MTKDTGRVQFCPHCGERTQQRLIHTQRYFLPSRVEPTDQEPNDAWSTFVAVCQSCGQVLLYESMGHQLPDEDFHLAEIEYP